MRIEIYCLFIYVLNWLIRGVQISVARSLKIVICSLAKFKAKFRIIRILIKKKQDLLLLIFNIPATFANKITCAVCRTQVSSLVKNLCKIHTLFQTLSVQFSTRINQTQLRCCGWKSAQVKNNFWKFTLIFVTSFFLLSLKLLFCLCFYQENKEAKNVFPNSDIYVFIFLC